MKPLPGGDSVENIPAAIQELFSSALVDMVAICDMGGLGEAVLLLSDSSMESSTFHDLLYFGFSSHRHY